MGSLTELRRECVEWLRFESDGTAEIGDDLSVIGFPAFITGKFGKGFYTNNVADFLKKIGETFFTPNCFILEHWLKSDFGVNNGQVDDGDNHALFQNFYDANNRIDLNFTNSAVFGTNLSIRVGGVNNFFFNIHANMDWTAGTLVHLIYVYDRAGIGGGADTVRMYLNGAKLFNSTSIPASQGNTGGTFMVGMMTPSVPERPVDSVIDNMKITFPGTVAENLIIQIINNNDFEGFKDNQAILL